MSDTLVAFTSHIANGVVIRDFTRPNDKGVEWPLKEPSLLSALRLTGDMRNLVQINSYGRLFVTRLSDAAVLLTGAYADDEIVISNSDGFYDATFEGAQLVNVKFSGVPGAYRFDQFERLLHRPGLAGMVMSGQRPAPSAEITAPPAASLFLDRQQKAGKRDGLVKFSSQGMIREIRILVDGRAAATADLVPGRAEASFSIEDPGPGHWISAVAVASNGLVSLPSAAKIPGQYAPNGKLQRGTGGRRPLRRSEDHAATPGEI